jgi:hypothetical protein
VPAGRVVALAAIAAVTLAGIVALSVFVDRANEKEMLLEAQGALAALSHLKAVERTDPTGAMGIADWLVPLAGSSSEAGAGLSVIARSEISDAADTLTEEQARAVLARADIHVASVDEPGRKLHLTGLEFDEATGAVTHFYYWKDGMDSAVEYSAASGVPPETESGATAE